MKMKEYCFYVTADLHFLSRKLYDEGEAFQMMMHTNDGKLTEYGDAIVDALIREVLRKRPNGVIIAGDMTFNGELESLKEITEKFRKVRDEGIPVYMIAGNHDISHRYARSYQGNQTLPVRRTEPDDFFSETYEFTKKDAVSSGPDSGSYLKQIGENLYLLGLDSNMPDTPDTVPPSVLSWAEEVLSGLPEAAAVIGLTHQNVLRQNPFINREIRSCEDVAALYRRHGIRLNLSGHAHIQHISCQDGLTDICTECLMIDPLQYGILKIRPDEYSFTYENRELGILKEEAKQRFRETVSRMITYDLEKKELPSDTIQRMLETAYEPAYAIFSGRPADQQGILQSEGWQDWQKYAEDTFWYAFLGYMLK